MSEKVGATSSHQRSELLKVCETQTLGKRLKWLS